MTDVFKKINDILKEKKDDYDDIYRILKKGDCHPKYILLHMQ